MVKKVLELIVDFFTHMGNGPFDELELCGWSKCPVPEKKEIIEEDYSI